MKPRTISVLAAAAMAVLLSLSIVSAAADSITRRDAARLQAKIDRINKNVAQHHAPGTLRTPVTENEVNSYLRYEMSDQLPTGVKDPLVSMVGDGRISGQATVDLSQVGRNGQKKSGGMLDPYSYLTGSLPVSAVGTLKAKNGIATFALESASISGVPVPVWMLQEIVSYYSKSASAPQGVSIDKPFALPAGIREIQLDRGQAIIVQ